MTILPKGVYTALVTPFTKEGNIDLPGLETLINEHIAAHVVGLILIGSTGEAPTLTSEEEKSLITHAVQVVRHRVPLLVGTGSPSTAIALQKLETASALGATAALVASPYYNRPTQEGLFRHFRALAEASQIPLVLYNHPGRTGVNIELETIRRLLPHPQIVGLKEASGNLSYFMETIRCFGEQLQIFSGDDVFAYPHMALGAHGLFSVASHLVPNAMVKLVSLVLERRLDEALSLHYKLVPLFQALCIESNPGPVKKGLEILGKPGGEPRLPLTPLSTHHIPALEKFLCHVHPTSQV